MGKFHTFKTKFGVKFPKIDNFQKLRFYCEDECTGQFSLPAAAVGQW
jgi:hypothetical protein